MYEIKVSIITKNVVDFMPPPVDPGLAPMNISNEVRRVPFCVMLL